MHDPCSSSFYRYPVKLGQRPQLCHPERAGGTSVALPSTTPRHLPSISNHAKRRAALNFVIPKPVLSDLFAFFAADQMSLITPPQRRHPERSVSQIYRITEGFMRAVQGPRHPVGRCSPELSGHKPQGKLKSHSPRAEPRDLLTALPSDDSRHIHPWPYSTIQDSPPSSTLVIPSVAEGRRGLSI